MPCPALTTEVRDGLASMQQWWPPGQGTPPRTVQESRSVVRHAQACAQPHGDLRRDTQCPLPPGDHLLWLWLEDGAGSVEAVP